MRTFLSFCAGISLGITFVAESSAPSMLRELEDYTLVNTILLTDSSSDFAQQHAALLHAALAQKGILCKEQWRQVNAFYARVKKSELSSCVKHQLISSLCSLVRHPRRKWIIALSLIGAVIGCIGISMIVAGMSQNWSKSAVPAAAQVQPIDVRDSPVNPFVSDVPECDRSVLPALVIERDQGTLDGVIQTPRRVATHSGPPGGSPEMGQGKNDPQYTPSFRTQWQDFLDSETLREKSYETFAAGYRVLIDAYDKGLLTHTIFESIIDQYFC